jgi:hypothetical protein
MTNKWYDPNLLVRNDGTQASAIQYPHLKAADIEAGVKRFYSKFYARPTPIFRMLVSMAKDPIERRRRLREGKEFLNYLRGRQQPAASRVAVEPSEKPAAKPPRPTVSV